MEERERGLNLIGSAVVKHERAGDRWRVWGGKRREGGRADGGRGIAG